jgi:outer membrane protein TolC
MFTSAVLSCVALGAVAEDVVLDQARVAIERHPSVAALRAEVCRSASQIDLARSGFFPQVNFRLTGANSLSRRIKRDEVDRRRHDEDDSAVDGVLSVNQTLYDWGITRDSVGIARNARSAALLGVQIESDRIAADILSIMVTREELRLQDQFFTDYRAKLAEISERIEAGVDAGVNRLADLRSIKITELDAEVAHTQALRQLALTEADLIERTELTFDAAMPFYLDYIDVRPLAVPTIESQATREVKRLDYNARSNELELKRTKAERLPAMSATLDTTLFDADRYSSEYQVVGRVQFTLPLYDGGSNKARQNEYIWVGRSIDHERQNLIRNHQSQTQGLLQRLDLLSESIANVSDRIDEVEQQLEGALARQGQTENQPLSIASIYTNLNGLFVERLALEREIELERLRGIFFADELGSTLSLSYGTSSC